MTWFTFSYPLLMRPLSGWHLPQAYLIYFCDFSLFSNAGLSELSSSDLKIVAFILTSS